MADFRGPVPAPGNAVRYYGVYDSPTDPLNNN